MVLSCDHGVQVVHLRSSLLIRVHLRSPRFSVSPCIRVSVVHQTSSMRAKASGYFAITLEVIDAITSEAILNCALRSVMPWRSAM